MKNKSLTYVLLIVVGVIWYQVFFRVKSNFWGDEELPTKLDARNIKALAFKRDTFDLAANYRDPFKGGITKEPTLNVQLPQNPAEIKPVIDKPKPLPERWPSIVYYGQIKKQSSKSPLALMTVDGMQFSLRKGEHVFDDYMIKEIYRDSVIVVHKKVSRSFRKGR